MKSLNNNILILDIDETLIYGWDPKLDPIEARPQKIDFETCGRFQIMKRPHVDSFLRWCFQNDLFGVAVWSAAGKCHVEGVLENICLPHELNTLEFVFYGNKCTSILQFPDDSGDDIRYLNIKDLKKVRRKGYDINRILVLDDQSRIWQRSYGNIICVKPFRGLNDDELLKVQPFIEQCFQNPQGVRGIEKRFWRHEKI